MVALFYLQYRHLTKFHSIIKNFYIYNFPLSCYLICRDTVELRHQSHPVFLFDQDALQSLLVLLDLDELTEFISNI